MNFSASATVGAFLDTAFVAALVCAIADMVKPLRAAEADGRYRHSHFVLFNI